MLLRFMLIRSTSWGRVTDNLVIYGNLVNMDNCSTCFACS